MNTRDRIKLTKREMPTYISYDCIVDQPIIRTEWNWFGDRYEEAYEILRESRIFNALPFTGLDIVVFPCLAWELTKGFDLYGCVVFDTDWAIKPMGRGVDFNTKWEYEYGTGEAWTDCAIGEEGYIKFRGRRSGLFSLSTIDDLFSLQVASFSDAVVSVNLYSVAQHNVAKLAKLLSRESRVPVMKEVMKICEQFIDIEHSLDYAYSHALSIKTRKDISLQLESVVGAMESRIFRFENELRGCESVERYLQALERLVCGEETK